MMKTCSKCKQVKDLDEFYKLAASKDGRQAWCRVCLNEYRRRYREENGPRTNTPEVARRAWLKHYYHLTPEQYDAMLEAQDNKCLLCRSEFKTTKDRHVDHDHSCCSGEKTCGECVRGILCMSCNLFVGALETKRHLLEKALAYAGFGIKNSAVVY